MKLIFVFGSNLAGVHGSGAARDALMHHGAIYHVGVGPQGMSYGIPTKDQNIDTLSLWRIKLYVDQFIEYAANSKDEFKVTRIGCGLARYTDEHIAPMFATAPYNCNFDTAWKPWLGNDAYYWGHK